MALEEGIDDAEEETTPEERPEAGNLERREIPSPDIEEHDVEDDHEHGPGDERKGRTNDLENGMRDGVDYRQDNGAGDVRLHERRDGEGKEIEGEKFNGENLKTGDVTRRCPERPGVCDDFDRDVGKHCISSVAGSDAGVKTMLGRAFMFDALDEEHAAAGDAHAWPLPLFPPFGPGLLGCALHVNFLLTVV